MLTTDKMNNIYNYILAGILSVGMFLFLQYAFHILVSKEEALTVKTRKSMIESTKFMVLYFTFFPISKLLLSFVMNLFN